VNLHFLHPWLLLFLVPIAAYLVWVVRVSAPAVPLPRMASVSPPSDRFRRILGRLPQILRALVLALLVVAIARPRSAGATIEAPVEGIPIVIAFDISSSMLAEDFAPRNRLEVARSTTSDFIRSRGSDPIGLVVFAGEAITQVPLTTDHRVLLAALDRLRIGLLEDGTAIGMGLATAAARLPADPEENRVIVLMSDGENNRGEIEPMEAAAAAAKQGIRVFTIGVGTDDAAPVPVFRAPDGSVQYAELSAGLDEELLREIAAMTGGEYFRADSPDALTEIYRRVDELVPVRFETRSHVLHSEWYLVLLLLGATALAAEWLLRASRWGKLP
jgi:Ca-activated chloride channel homolog